MDLGEARLQHGVEGLELVGVEVGVLPRGDGLESDCFAQALGHGFLVHRHRDQGGHLQLARALACGVDADGGGQQQQQGKQPQEDLLDHGVLLVMVQTDDGKSR